MRAMHRVLTPGDYRHSAWKNGAGRTVEIAAYPHGSGFEHFAWRASVADIERDGPFSVFPGVDRTLVLLQGAGQVLADAGDPIDVRAHFEPMTFSGDVALDCKLHEGPVRNFNLMVRRARAQGEVDVVQGTAETAAPTRFRLCYAAVGSCECLLAGHLPITLNETHTLYVDAEDAPPPQLHVNPLSSDAIVLVASIRLTGGHR